MMDVLEHFVHDAFIAPARKQNLDTKMKKLSTKVPTRKPRKKSDPPKDS
jgi:hypothetical protein